MGGTILAMVIAIAILAPVLAPADPQAINVRNRLAPPSAESILGTDHLGRDVLSRILHGARVSMIVGITVTIGATIGGVFIGLLGGYGHEIVRSITMRVVDGMMAFPGILLALALVAVLGPSLTNVMIALSVVYMPRMGRIVQAAVLQIKVRDYVEAAVALGGTQPQIVLRHILPGTLASILVQGTFAFAHAVISEAGLSFLGVGAPPDIPTWGNVLSTGRNYMLVAPWITIFPGLAIFVVVISLNILGDGLRDLSDPHSQFRKTSVSQQSQ